VKARLASLVANLGDAPYGKEPEILRAAYVALDVGARPPLTFAGMGMTAVVICDARPVAYKVARRSSPTSRRTLETEAEWLATASSAPETRRHVARFHAFHRANAVIERECVRRSPAPSRVASWKSSNRRPSAKRERETERETRLSRQDVHEHLSRMMARYGFGHGPEFKEDSYVWARGRGWVLVDAGFALQTGARLVSIAARVLRGESIPGWDASQVAFAVRCESGTTIPPAIAASLDRKLSQLAHDRDRARRFSKRPRYRGAFSRRVRP
jgi:hypothetical protein